MKTKYTMVAFALAVALVTASCGQQQDRKNRNTSKIAASSAMVDSIGLRMDLSSGYAMTGLRKDSMQTAWVMFDSPGGEAIYGKITLPGNIGNVRFNQITMPDGSMDGPFGRDIKYDLTTAGTYSLAIGESLMQGDPYAGEFTVELFTGKVVPYKQISNYFVRNDVEDNELLAEKITSRQDFENLFGAAATMTSRPENIDFEKQYLVAIIVPSTDNATELGIEKVLLKDGILTVIYRMTQGEKQSFTTRTFTLIGIDKENEGSLRAISASN